MRRFEFSDGKSNKYWEVDVEGSEVTVRYGRIGTNGQTKTKSHATAEAAQADGDKQIASKVKKAYAEVGTTASAGREPETTPIESDPAPVPPAAPHEPSASFEETVSLPDDVRDQLLPARSRPGPAPALTPNASTLFSTLRFEVELTGWDPELQPEPLEAITRAALVRLRTEGSTQWVQVPTVFDHHPPETLIPLLPT